MLKQLRYFQSVVRLNSFSGAAEENFISQSAISQQVQALERELGFQLLERKNRGFTLTAAGEYFYQKSLILTADYERMCSEAAKIAHGDRASLRIGYLRCYTGGEFHRALALFSEKHPDVEVSVTYGNHEELYGLLRTGAADLVLNDQRRGLLRRIRQSAADHLRKLYRGVRPQSAGADGAHFTGRVEERPLYSGGIGGPA